MKKPYRECRQTKRAQENLDSLKVAATYSPTTQCSTEGTDVYCRVVLVKECLGWHSECSTRRIPIWRISTAHRTTVAATLRAFRIRLEGSFLCLLGMIIACFIRMLPTHPVQPIYMPVFFISLREGGDKNKYSSIGYLCATLALPLGFSLILFIMART